VDDISYMLSAVASSASQQSEPGCRLAPMPVASDGEGADGTHELRVMEISAFRRHDNGDFFVDGDFNP
jgi:hypothetical protein